LTRVLTHEGAFQAGLHETDVIGGRPASMFAALERNLQAASQFFGVLSEVIFKGLVGKFCYNCV
jgi:hypothetical protein